jgi:signal transduction histidine kinase
MLNASREDPDVSVIPASLALSDEIAVVAVCQRGLIRAVNRAFCHHLGFGAPSVLVGKSLRDELVVQRSDWSTWKRTTATGETHDVSFNCRAADGSTVRFRGAIERLPLRHPKEPIVRAMLYDDTGSRQLEEVSMRLADHEALSTLTAGVSHDFKNLLTVLVGNLYLISEVVDSTSPAHEKIKRARDTAKRGAELATQLLDLAVGRQGAAENLAGEPINPRAVILKLVPLLSAAVGQRVMLRTAFSGEIPPLAVNRAAFESVITNLVINARDSFGPAGGTVTVSVAPIEIGAALAMSLNVSPGTYVETKIEDDGRGIPEGLLAKVFEPFFSTKAKGKGCGLGLPMVRWFAERSGGAARLTSSTGKGTTVRLLLPAETTELGDTTVQTMPLSALPAGSETIVVLSDSAELRETIREILSTLGYKVVPGALASAPQTMLAHPAAAALLVDGVGLTPSVAQQIRRWVERRSSATGVVVIGDGHCEMPGPIPPICIPKPFGLKELTAAVRQAVGD